MKPGLPLLLLFCLLLLPGTGHSAGQQDERLDALLVSGIQTVLGVSEWPCLYSGQFVQQRQLPGSKASLTSSGKFLYSCEQGLLWEIHKPIVESLVYTHAGKHVRVRAGGQVKTLDGIIQARVARLLLGLLGGNSAELGKDFESVDSTSNPDQLTLVPKRQSLRQHIQKITLLSEPASMTVHMDASGSGDTELNISGFELPAGLPVIACAATSLLPDTACKRLFDPVGND